MAAKYSDWKWNDYYWHVCEQFGRECYKTWRWELAASVIGYLFTALITHRWRDFRINLITAGLTLAALVLWHFVRSPWLLRKAEIGKEPQPGKAFGLFGAVVIIGLFVGGYALTNGLLTEDVRHLTPNQLETFIGMVRPYSGSTVHVGKIPEDQEAYELADQLELGLYLGYWRTSQQDPMTLLGGGAPVNELTIVYNDPNDKRHESIQDALTRAGITSESRLDVDNKYADITVYVGKHASR
jgi:hypothetical protein